MIQASLFEDGTNMSCEGHTNADIEYKLNMDLSNVHNWLKANRLTLNSEKTKYMIIGSRQRLEDLGQSLEIVINKEKIKRANDKKFRV